MSQPYDIEIGERLKNFVMIYGIDEKDRTVIFLEFTHHDEAYKQ